MPKFNEFQKAAIRAYPNDEAKYLLEDDEVDTQNVSVGDSLFTFIIRELDDHMDIEEAIQRMETARADIETVLHALNKLKEGKFSSCNN
jgi:RNA polymerase-binding transcription factor DksA